MSENLCNPNELIGDRYQKIGFIGQGGMQVVCRAIDTLMGREVALKTPKNTSAEKRFERSARVSAKVNHPNVAKTLDFLEVNSQLYLIEEFVEGRDLQKALLDAFPYVDPYLAARILHHLAKGIAASHRVGVVHRDLKPNNVMISGGINLSAIKITDFGIAKMAEEELAQAVAAGESSISNSATALGAVPYMSPEMINTPRSVGTATDIWSVGAMTYELLSGQKPFGEGYRAIPKILLDPPPSRPEWIGLGQQFTPLGDALYQLIVDCLQKDPNDRLTADELVKRCEQLCYPISERKVGIVRRFTRSNQGFIQEGESGKDIFFHFDSVYGEKPILGSKVCFSEFLASPSPRAHPVIVMLAES